MYRSHFDFQHDPFYFAKPRAGGPEDRQIHPLGIYFQEVDLRNSNEFHKCIQSNRRYVDNGLYLEFFDSDPGSQRLLVSGKQRTGLFIGVDVEIRAAIFFGYGHRNHNEIRRVAHHFGRSAKIWLEGVDSQTRVVVGVSYGEFSVMGADVNPDSLDPVSSDYFVTQLAEGAPGPADRLRNHAVSSPI